MLKDYPYNVRQLFRKYKIRAKNSSLEFSLTPEQFYSLTQQNCYLCNSVPKSKHDHYKKLGNEPFVYNGIDRVDNTKGYVLGNCMPCCGECNFMKRNLGLGKFLGHIKKIINHVG